MRLVLLLLLALSTIFANQTSELLKRYENAEYKQICTDYSSNIKNYRKSEKFVLLYSFSCLEAGYIDSLAVPITMLKYSKDARDNASYFATILLQKKILYNALIDDVDISSLRLPTTTYILSKVFDLYVKNKNNPVDGVYRLDDTQDADTFYKLYISSRSHIKKMVIEVYKNKKLENRYIYW
ncbi:MAG: hypothetical protein GQ570_06320 [Helicobacteraceae bacterium]|nr:hypothetical protein [Helicobacteraceae bacterium]